MRKQRERGANQGEILERCLGAFIQAGTLDLSLDHLAQQVGVSKRMLVHYFGGRERLEHGAMERLETRLRAQFMPAAFPVGVSPEAVILSLWERTTAPASRGVLLLVMDLSRRAWNGSMRARAFYEEQQRLWEDLLQHYIADREDVLEMLQLFQGAVLAYLVTGNPEPGRQALRRLAADQ
jgi:AcrR family transcriptional regulator